MGASSAYSTAVVAGAMTAGIGAANVLAVPPDVAVSTESSRGVNLAAAPIEIPIINIGPTPGPLSITRKLFLQLGTDPLLLGLRQQGGNTYNLPGLNTDFDSTSNPRVVATPGTDSVDFAFLQDRTQDGGWDLLGGAFMFMKSPRQVRSSRQSA